MTGVSGPPNWLMEKTIGRDLQQTLKGRQKPVEKTRAILISICKRTYILDICWEFRGQLCTKNNNNNLTTANNLWYVNIIEYDFNT